MAASAGIVLAGGQSSRMGTSKAALEWHGSTLLRRVTGVLARVVDGPVVVVRAPGQALPPLPAQVDVIDDPREGLGPLQGLAAGLAATADLAEAAFVCSTDLPFLHPAFVRRVLRVLGEGVDGDVDVGLPIAHGYPQPLAAAYRTALAPVAERLVAAHRLRLAFLFDECAVVRLDEAALRADPVLAVLDPDLDSVININEPDDYAAARARTAPEVTIQCFGALADGRSGPRVIHAATMAAAAAAAGLALGRHVAAALNGDQITRDGEMPLATGDTVSFLAADAAADHHGSRPRTSDRSSAAGDAGTPL
jgi:molybdopterin-guanine dinucleotide biosynthesis protein A